MKVNPNDYSKEAHELVAGMFASAVENDLVETSANDLVGVLVTLMLAEEVIKLQRELNLQRTT